MRVKKESSINMIDIDDREALQFAKKSISKGDDLSQKVHRIVADGSVTKTILEYGDPCRGVPPPLSCASLHVIGIVKKSKYCFLHSMMEEFECHLGKGESARGLEMSIATMHIGELARIVCTSEYGFTDLKRPENVPREATLQFEVRLLRFDNTKTTWQMNDDQKPQRIRELRELGNEQYSLARYETAFRTYQRGIEVIRSVDDGERSRIVPVLSRDEQKQHLLPFFMNSAACKLKLHDYVETISYCTQAMAVPGAARNVKCLFRRAQAYRARQEYDRANADFTTIIASGHDTTAVRNEIERVNNMVKRGEIESKKRIGGFLRQMDYNPDMHLYSDKPDCTSKSFFALLLEPLFVLVHIVRRLCFRPAFDEN